MALGTLNRPDYQERRDRFCAALWDVGFEFAAPAGAYYIMAGIGAFGVEDDVAFARRPSEGPAGLATTDRYTPPEQPDQSNARRERNG